MSSQAKAAPIPPAVTDLLAQVPAEPPRESESTWVEIRDWRCDLKSLYGRR